MEILWDNIALSTHGQNTFITHLCCIDLYPRSVFTLEFTSLQKTDNCKHRLSFQIQVETERWSDRSWNGTITETCGLYCTQQLVGVNRNEHATLSAAQRGLKILAVNRVAGLVPVLSGDWGSSGMWDSHHLASFTPISPENQPWPHLRTRVSVCVCVFICALVRNMSNCVKDTVSWRETKCLQGWLRWGLNLYWKLAERGGVCVLWWRTYCLCLLHGDFKINAWLKATWNEIKTYQILYLRSSISCLANGYYIEWDR